MKSLCVTELDAKCQAGAVCGFTKAYAFQLANDSKDPAAEENYWVKHFAADEGRNYRDA